MKLTTYLLLICFTAYAEDGYSQAEKPGVSGLVKGSVIREVERPMTTYPYSDPDPVARPGRVYPYFRFDGFTNKSEMRNWKMVELRGNARNGREGMGGY